MTRNDVGSGSREVFVQKWNESVSAGSGEEIVPIDLLVDKMSQLGAAVGIQFATRDAEDYFSHRFHGFFADFRNNAGVSFGVIS